MTLNAEKVTAGSGIGPMPALERTGGLAAFGPSIPPVHPELGWIVIWAPGEAAYVHCRMGDDPPVLSGGYGGWAETARPRKVATTAWEGSSPFRLAVKLRIGEHRRLRSVEADCRRLDRLATRQGRPEPPIIAIHARQLPVTATQIEDWVVESLEWGPATYNANGARVMADASLTLMQHVWPGEAEILPASRRVVCSKARSPVKHYTVKKGDTIQKISARYLGSAACWKRILILGHDKRYQEIRDPRRLKAGDKLRLP